MHVSPTDCDQRQCNWAKIVSLHTVIARTTFNENSHTTNVKEKTTNSLAENTGNTAVCLVR